MKQPYIHLNLHTEFSIKDGMVRIDPLMDALISEVAPSVAITDHMNLFAAVKFYKAALSRGIKPIIGCELLCQYALSHQQGDCFKIIVLCQNMQGYQNLTQLISLAYEQGQIQGIPRIEYKWLLNHKEGLIVLSGGIQSDVGKAISEDKLSVAQSFVQSWKEHFSNQLYFEIQRIGRSEEAKFNQKLVELADEFQIPLIATNAVCFLNADDFEAHEARVCIHEGRVLADSNRTIQYFSQQYLKSQAEMQELFKDLPQALSNTIEVSKRCNVILSLGKSYLPNFPTPEQTSVDEFLSMQSKKGLQSRIPYLSANVEFNLYEQRLDTELSVIINMGFSGYFLIVADFIQWAKDNQIPVGPGRGSGAGSLVAYALGITDLDPLEYDLLFERFLNPERVSMPDFDVDFCMIGRDRVIDYVAKRYGRECVAQIITFGTMAAKAVVRDVGRVLGYPYNFVDKIAKLIPFELGMTLESALSQEPELFRRYQDEEDVRDLLNLAKKLEGITRNAGKHAGGVVIAPSRLTDFTAIYCEEHSTQKVSQFDKDDVEAVGLVKFDFLGLRTLTIIDEAIKNIQQINSQERLDIARISLRDEQTFKLMQTGKTTAVFQLESRGMQELIQRLKPDCFEDIIALVALFRPGPLQSGMVDDFIDRKQGRSEILYLHPDLEDILKPTYGVILYQEQVMQIAQVLANYTLGAADLLRRAMGKKKPEEMAKQRDIFVKGAAERGVDSEISSQIFDLMEKFAGYGFNKSHSAAYALVSYQTAWLKTHYPAAFMAAVLSADMDNTDKVVHMLNECQHMRLTITKPSINQSIYRFYVKDQETIIYGLGAIKGIGEAAVELIIKERELHGHYQSIQDLCKRLDLRKINKRVLEALIKSGALDEFNLSRAILWHQLEDAMKLGAQNWTNNQLGQHHLFDLFDEAIEAPQAIKPWAFARLLEAEKETLGWYASGHPSAPIVDEFKDICLSFEQLKHTKQKVVRLCGLVHEWRKMLTKKGKLIIILTLAQAKETIDLILFPDKLPEHMLRFSAGDLVFIEGELGIDAFRQQPRVIVQKIQSAEEARIQYAKMIKLNIMDLNEQAYTQLKNSLELNSGNCQVKIVYQSKGFHVEIKLGTDWRVHPSDSCLEGLKNISDELKLDVIYND